MLHSIPDAGDGLSGANGKPLDSSCKEIKHISMVKVAVIAIKPTGQHLASTRPANESNARCMDGGVMHVEVAPQQSRQDQRLPFVLFSEKATARLNTGVRWNWSDKQTRWSSLV